MAGLEIEFRFFGIHIIRLHIRIAVLVHISHPCLCVFIQPIQCPLFRVEWRLRFVDKFHNIFRIIIGNLHKIQKRFSESSEIFKISKSKIFEFFEKARVAILYICNLPLSKVSLFGRDFYRKFCICISKEAPRGISKRLHKIHWNAWQKRVH